MSKIIFHALRLPKKCNFFRNTVRLGSKLIRQKRNATLGVEAQLAQRHRITPHGKQQGGTTENPWLSDLPSFHEKATGSQKSQHKTWFRSFKLTTYLLFLSRGVSKLTAWRWNPKNKLWGLDSGWQLTLYKPAMRITTKLHVFQY